MGSTLPLFPEQASTMAPRVDALYFYLLAVSSFFSVLIALTVIYFAIRYRRRSETELPAGVEGSLKLELTWTLVPLVIALSFFFWGARLFFAMNRPPDNALEVYVVGKQWMWKLQHADGQREINELHVPVGRPVRLTMTSEDVIHDFFVPAFRMKQDVLPGRYSTAWFQATKAGRYHLFCSQYCGTKHSAMTGWIDVLEPVDYENWLAGGVPGESLASAGAKLFLRHACNTCHGEQAGARGPALAGLFGKTVHLQGGQILIADESYIRESILNPNAKIVEGYPPIMPTFQGLLSEEELLELVAYLKSLPVTAATSGPPAAAAPMPNTAVPRKESRN